MAKSGRPAGRAVAAAAARERPLPAAGPAAAKGPASWLLAALVLLPPFVFVPSLEESFRQPKLLVSELLVLAGLVALSFRVRALPRLELAALARHPAVLATVPVLVAATATLATSAHPHHVRDALPSLWIGAAALVGWSLALGDEERWRLLRLTVPAGVLLSLFAVFQFHVANPFAFRESLSRRLGTTSLAGNPFDFAAYLVIPLLVAQVELGRTADRRRRALWIAAVVVCLWGIVVSQTLALLVVVPLASLVLWAPRLGRRRLAAAAGVAIVVLAAAGIGFPPLRKRLAVKLEDLAAGEVNRLLTGRLDGWRAAAWMTSERPLAGIGHGAFRAEFGRAKLALVARGVEFDITLRESYFTNAHNDFLEAAAEWGVAGGLAALWAAALVVVGLRGSGSREGVLDDAERLAFPRAAVLAIALLALTNFPFHVALVAYPFLLVLSGVLVPRPARLAT